MGVLDLHTNGISRMNDMKNIKGLGDLVERIASSTGIKKLAGKVFRKGCGCASRRDRLNKLLPFRGEQ